MKSVRLSSLLARLAHVDLIHTDVQSAELAIMREAADQLDAKVRRLHIGTHNADVEAGLRLLFSHRGWICLRDYEAGSTSHNPYGEMTFQDGVQTWVNPQLTITDSGT